MSDASAKLLLPSVGLLRRYLGMNGWQRTLLPRGDLDLFTLNVGDAALEIVLPAGAGDRTSIERILPALSTLASVSGRDVPTVAADIAMLDFDVIRARLPDSAVLRDSVQLRVAEKFLTNTRRFLTSAGAAEGRRLQVDDPHKAGLEYANACRFGHTFRGSFGFTIESKAGPAPELTDGDSSPPPFERRVVERIARGLANVESAFKAGSPALLQDSSTGGLDVGMLEDVTSLIADTAAAKVTFSFSLTPAWQARTELPLTAEIPQEALPLIDRAVAQMRPPVVPATETIVGQVIMLQTREDPTDLLHEGTREILVDGVSVQRGPITVRVRLSPADYLSAFRAHGVNRAVTVTGLVTRSSRGNSLTNPTGFREA